MELKRNKICNTQSCPRAERRDAIRDTKYAFTLVEILIVVAILGILAAIVLPTFRGHIAEAKESAAKDNLRILRNAVELYAARNNGVPPGYAANNPNAPPLFGAFLIHMVRGRYISKMPKNPFNDLTTIRMISNSDTFPATPTGQYGWVYQPRTKTIKLDWTGTDKDGVSYYDY